MTTTVETLPVEYDATIRGNAEYYELARTGTAEFEERYRIAPPVEHDRHMKLAWSLSKLQGKEHLIAEFAETDADAVSRTVRKFIPVSQARDPASLRYYVLELLGDLLMARSRTIGKRIDTLIRELEAEERHGAVSD